MYRLNYEGLMRRLQAAMTRRGLRARREEVLYMSDLARVCEFLIQFPHRGSDERPWGKLIVEWTPENEALANRLREVPPGAEPLPDEADRGVQISLHAAFHLHFDTLPISIGRVHAITEKLRSLANAYFGGEGDVVAEVRLAETEASLACLRYEVNADAPLVTAEEWWHTWAELFYGMLLQLNAIYGELEAEFQGPEA